MISFHVNSVVPVLLTARTGYSLGLLTVSLLFPLILHFLIFQSALFLWLDSFHFVCVCVHTHSCECSVVSDSLPAHGLWPTSLLCPWNFPGSNTGMGTYFLLQGIYSIQGLNPCLLRLLHWQADSLPLITWEASYHISGHRITEAISGLRTEERPQSQ